VRIQYFPAEYVDLVVTGNWKVVGYENLCWNHVTRDQLRKWVLQIK